MEDPEVDAINNYPSFSLTLTGWEIGQIQSLIRLTGQTEINPHLRSVNSKIDAELDRFINTKAWPSVINAE